MAEGMVITEEAADQEKVVVEEVKGEVEDMTEMISTGESGVEAGAGAGAGTQEIYIEN